MTGVLVVVAFVGGVLAEDRFDLVFRVKRWLSQRLP